MENVVWIGKYREDMGNFKIIGSVTKYGVSDKDHFVHQAEMNSSFLDFVIEKLSYFNQSHEDVVYYFYSQLFAYELINSCPFKINCICLNDENVINWLNNKAITRQWFYNIVKTPPTMVMSESEIIYKNIQNSFMGYNKFIVQKFISSGGKNTYLLDETTNLKLEKDLYIVSPFFEKSISINVTSLIGNNNIIIFPTSIQIINFEYGKFLYNGSDFISADDFSENIKNTIYKCVQIINQKLQQINYHGICGIDFLIYNDDVYFLEINPRFQGSSFLIDKELQSKNSSLYSLNLEIYNGTLKNSIINELNGLKINYSFQYDAGKIRKCSKAKTNIISSDYSTNTYYDYYANLYHIMLKDWENKIEKQGKIFVSIFNKFSKIKVISVLDCTCGIGIQSISLSKEGLEVTGSDISKNELSFAKTEASKRSLNIDFQEADCRYLELVFRKKFDAIISIDNALPHLMTRENFILTFQSIYQRLNKGGIFLSSYRDYEDLLKTKPNMAYPVRFASENNKEYTIIRKWHWDGNIINSKQYVIVDEPSESKLLTSDFKQWAITKNELITIAEETKYSEIYWLLPEDSRFTQPLLCLIK